MTADASSSTTGGGDAAAAAAPGILVVDDDPLLLSMLHMVFRRAGFQVWTSGEGQAALEVYREHQGEIGVVLLDVCMPGLDGPATLAALKAINPAVRTCFMSGHTGRYSTEDLKAMGALRFFDKPFQIQQLADELWQVARGGAGPEDVRRSA